MPWKECNIVEERRRFVARLLDGEKMAPLCRDFGISRKTGYKIFNRYKDLGLEGLTDRSRRPQRHANQLPVQIEKLIVRLKKDKPKWGAPKIRERLRRLYPEVRAPAIFMQIIPGVERNLVRTEQSGHISGQIAACSSIKLLLLKFL